MLGLRKLRARDLSHAERGHLSACRPPHSRSITSAEFKEFRTKQHRNHNHRVHKQIPHWTRIYDRPLPEPFDQNSLTRLGYSIKLPELLEYENRRTSAPIVRLETGYPLAPLLYMNSPETLNHISPVVANSLKEYSLYYGASNAYSCVMLRSFGSAWCSGLDFVTLATAPEQEKHRYLDNVISMLRYLNNWQKPFIPLLDSACNGVGSSLFLAGGIRIATERSVMAFNDAGKFFGSL